MGTLVFYAVWFYGFLYQGPNEPLKQYAWSDNIILNFGMIASAFLLAGMCLRQHRHKLNRSKVVELD